MKKLTLLVISVLILVACSGDKSQTVVCVKDYEDELHISREISLTYTNNLITSLKTVDKISYNETFTEASVEQLEAELSEKLKDSKNVSYEITKESDAIIVTASLSNLNKSSASEYSFMGISVNAKDEPIGLKETVSLNEAEGFVCKEVEN